MAVANGPYIRKTYLVDSLVLVWLESRLIDGDVLVDIDDLIRGKSRHGSSSGLDRGSIRNDSSSCPRCVLQADEQHEVQEVERYHFRWISPLSLASRLLEVESAFLLPKERIGSFIYSRLHTKRDNLHHQKIHMYHRHRARNEDKATKVIIRAKNRRGENRETAFQIESENRIPIKLEPRTQSCPGLSGPEFEYPCYRWQCSVVMTMEKLVR
jgi:hypothetical protein